MFALPIFMLRFKSINFYQNILKIKLFMQKMRPQASVHLAAGGFVRRPPASQNIPHCEFLATRLVFLLLLCYFV